MKAVCISCFNYYSNRLSHVEQILINKGYDVTYITSDFDHIDKKKYKIDRQNVTQINVIPYYKNLSINRLLSHYLFAKKVFKEISRVEPDLLYVMVPPNFLTRFVSKYKKRRKKVKLIYDIYDLWPETFPSSNVKKTLNLFFKLWGNLRDKNLCAADIVVTECELYQEKLKHVLAGMDSDVLYLTKQKSKLNPKLNINLDSVDICYLGSINNIIDTTLISKLLSTINKIKPVNLHIIGDGENREQFIESVESKGVKVEFYGKIYDEEKKREIFDRCQFGLNIMKNTVCVGLTMKSIDYFEAGLPILNNIKFDTAKLVDKYNIGINITEENILDIAKMIANISVNRQLEMRSNTYNVFDKHFSNEAFNNKLEEIIGRL